MVTWKSIHSAQHAIHLNWCRLNERMRMRPDPSEAPCFLFVGVPYRTNMMIMRKFMKNYQLATFICFESFQHLTISKQQEEGKKYCIKTEQI